jgi:hypothetical protein
MGKMTECHLRVALVVAAWQRLRRRKNGRAFAAIGPLRDVMNGRCAAETLRTRRGGTAPIASSLVFSNQMALNSALTVRPLALNVALGLIACRLMKVHGGGANRRHPNSPGLGGVLRP